MKLRDNKRTRNYRLWREMNAARDRRENLIGADTGFTDKFGNAIRTGENGAVQIPRRNAKVRVMTTPKIP